MVLNLNSITLIVEALIGLQLLNTILFIPLAVIYSLTMNSQLNQDWDSFTTTYFKAPIEAVGMQATGLLQLVSNILLLVLTITATSGFDASSTRNILIFGVLPTVLALSEAFLKVIVYSIVMAFEIYLNGWNDLYYPLIEVGMLAPFINLLPVAITNVYFFDFPMDLVNLI